MEREPTLVEKVAAYATALTYDEISPEAREICKLIIFDSLGTGLGGYQHPLGQKMLRYTTGLNHGRESTVLGSGTTLTSEEAAFANATMIKILGMDNSHRSASHIASQVIPAALAMAEAELTSGHQLLTAVVAAYDFAVRVGHAVRAAQRKRGLDVKGTVGTQAAALAAGVCAGFDAETLAHAMALAADLSSGTEQYVYEGGPCDTKDLIAGFAARNGVLAAKLARAGFFGPRKSLDGEYGFFRAFGDGYDPDIFADLGDHFSIITTAFKPHGGCRHTHQAVDAVQKILAEGSVAPDDIQHVLIETYQYALQPNFRVDPDPPARDVAGLSIRVAAAVALVHGSAWPDDFRSWDDPDVRRLRHLIDVAVEPEIEGNYPDQNGCRVTLTLANGETRVGHVPYAKGEPEFRMSTDELVEKFAVLTRGVLSSAAADGIFSFCLDLEEKDGVGELLALTKTIEPQVEPA